MAGLLGSEKVTLPIIEPVRKPAGSGLSRCLDTLNINQIPFMLIANPGVGDLQGDGVSSDIAEYVNFADEQDRWNIALLVDEYTSVEGLIREYKANYGTSRPLSVINMGLSSELDILRKETSDVDLRHIVIDKDLRTRYFRDFRQVDRVTLRDGFPNEDRNADYLGREESMFTDEHIYYREEGWAGFSDFLTIGQTYSDGGFTPRAVAIHWTYEPSEGSPIMIRHFTSESNNGISNVGGKFLEAAQKLVAFADANNINTRASNIYRDHVRDGTYPGLGIVKKLSIQNHLELMSGILSRQ